MWRRCSVRHSSRHTRRLIASQPGAMWSRRPRRVLRPWYGHRHAWCIPRRCQGGLVEQGEFIVHCRAWILQVLPGQTLGVVRRIGFGQVHPGADLAGFTLPTGPVDCGGAGLAAASHRNTPANQQLRCKVQVVFQDDSLSPRLTVRNRGRRPADYEPTLGRAGPVRPCGRLRFTKSAWTMPTTRRWHATRIILGWPAPAASHCTRTHPIAARVLVLDEPTAHWMSPSSGRC